MSPSKQSPLTRTLYTGNFLWTPSLGQLKVLEKAVIGVDENGTIAFILENGEDEPMESARGSGDVQLRFPLLEKVRRHGWKDGEWDCVVGGNGGTGWWFPGFIGALLRYLLYRLPFFSICSNLLVLFKFCDYSYVTFFVFSLVMKCCFSPSAVR